MTKEIKNIVGHSVYRLMENIDGERIFKVMPYKYAQIIKMYCLINLIKE